MDSADIHTLRTHHSSCHGVQTQFLQYATIHFLELLWFKIRYQQLHNCLMHVVASYLSINVVLLPELQPVICLQIHQAFVLIRAT